MEVSRSISVDLGLKAKAAVLSVTSGCPAPLDLRPILLGRPEFAWRLGQMDHDPKAISLVHHDFPGQNAKQMFN